MTGGKEVRDNNLNSGWGVEMELVGKGFVRRQKQNPQAREPTECESGRGAEIKKRSQVSFHGDCTDGDTMKRTQQRSRFRDYDHQFGFTLVELIFKLDPIYDGL